MQVRRVTAGDRVMTVTKSTKTELNGITWTP